MKFTNPRSLLTCLSLGMAVGVAAHAADTPRLLTDSRGMTVYTYDPDTLGHSNCNGGCAIAWPPVAVTGDVKAPFSIVTRKDGSRQLAYESHPLYTYVGDSKPGDTEGDGLDGIWHVVPADQK